MQPSLHSALTGLALLTLSLSAQADVIVVDKAGGGDFTNLQAAVAAAAEGDTLFVKGGSYGALDIQGKSLNVAADPGGHVRVTSIGVSDLTIDQRVVLTGLEAHVAPTFIARNSDGAIWVQGCLFDQDSGPAPYSGAEAHDATNLVFVGCTIEGGSDPYDYDGGNGLFMFGRSRVAAWNSTFRGGAGGQLAFGSFAGDGGHGVRMWHEGQLYAMNCTFVGAVGGPGGTAGPDGIDGAGASIASTGVAVFADNVTQGAGGAPATVGPIQDLGVAARTFIAPPVVESGSVSTWTVAGQPGDLAFVLRSSAPDHRYLPIISGVLAVSTTSFSAQPIGVLDVFGFQNFDYVAPSLPAGVESLVGYHQMLVRTAEGELIVGNPSAVEVFAVLP